VLRATTVCTFSSSQLPKVVRTWCVLYILTWTCASRHNGVHFFIISTSKRGPNLFFFVHFDLDMCFAPQRRALFHRLNIQKWSEHPPCIALYEVDILCAYKVGFRSPLYTRPWGIKPCSAQETCPWTWNMTLYNDKETTQYAAMLFIDRWFPSKNGHNMSRHPL